MARIISTLVAIAAMAASDVCVAQIGYTLSSLESLVARSDLVVRGTVAGVAIEPVRERWVWKTVTLRVQETLKGEHRPQLEFGVEAY